MIFDLLAISAIVASIVWLVRSPGIAPVIALAVSLVALIAHVVWDYHRRKAQHRPRIYILGGFPPRSKEEQRWAAHLRPPKNKGPQT